MTISKDMSRMAARLMVLAFVISAIGGCGGGAAAKKDKDFTTSGSQEADQRADQRMAKDAQLKGGEGTYNVTEAGLNGGFASRRSEDALVVQAVGAVSTNVGDGRRLHARQEAAQAAAAQAAVLAPVAAGGAVGTGKVSSARQPGERRRALNAEAIVTAPAQGTGEASDV